MEVGLGWRPALHVCWVPELSHTITTPRCGVGRGGSTGFWFNLRHGLDYIGDRDREPGLMGRQIERQQRKVVPLLTTLLTPYGGSSHANNQVSKSGHQPSCHCIQF